MIRSIVTSIIKLLLNKFLSFWHYKLTINIEKKGILHLSDGINPTFFGYHDKTPFSGDNSKILAMSVSADDTSAASECSPMKLGYFSKNETDDFQKSFTPFTETNTWCWQQGCMLQWYPKNVCTEVIFNKLVNNKYGAAILNINSNTVVKEFETPIYSISPDGNYASSLNFSRLGRLRPGYGYSLFPDETLGINSPKDDGLFLLDISSGEKKLLVSLEALANDIDNLHNEHYLNHATFSPDSKYITFFHLWTKGGKSFSLRFLLYDIEKNNYRVIESKQPVSHYCWLNTEEIIATVQNNSNRKWKYTKYNISNGFKNTLNSLKIYTDGHPMASPIDKNIILTDNRIDRLRNDYIMLFNIKTGNVFKVARFFIPNEYQGQVRCDLHPRWDRTGRYIAADTVYKNRRVLTIIDFQKRQELVSK